MTTKCITNHNAKNNCCCSSIGGKPGSRMRCHVCNGRGVKVTMRQIAPGMVQQMQSVCPECRGEGMYKYRFLDFHCLCHFFQLSI